MTNRTEMVAIGLDFGTESVRAVIVGLNGVEHGAAVESYAHGQITERLPGSASAGGGRTSVTALPASFALQDPGDWVESAGRAVRAAMREGGVDAKRVIGIGVDFTSCTMLPTTRNGAPLSTMPAWADRPQAWAKLWKHHGAENQAADLTRVAKVRGETWLARYGGTIGLEWLFPKMLETFDEDREVFDAAEVFVEAGDWFTWWMVGRPANAIPRSTCQAGYKACWSRATGYPSGEYLNAVRAGFGDAVLRKLPGRFLAPGERAGYLTPKAAIVMGLDGAMDGGNGTKGVAVSAAIIDAHAGVPGAGVGEADVMVMVMGTSSCHMLNSDREVMVPGVAGIVRDGILPGFTGYEMGQAATGDAFAWLAKTTGQSLRELADEAERIGAGAGGVACVDWFNGCRTPLMDGTLKATLSGLTLGTTPAHLYRAILEGVAYGCRWIVELLRDHGVAVKGFTATGGLPQVHRIIVQTHADVLGAEIAVHPSKHGPAVGAAILGAMAAGAEATGIEGGVREAVVAMAAKAEEAVRPTKETAGVHEAGYRRYREMATRLH